MFVLYYTPIIVSGWIDCLRSWMIKFVSPTLLIDYGWLITLPPWLIGNDYWLITLWWNWLVVLILIDYPSNWLIEIVLPPHWLIATDYLSIPWLIMADCEVCNYVCNRYTRSYKLHNQPGWLISLIDWLQLITPLPTDWLGMIGRVQSDWLGLKWLISQLKLIDYGWLYWLIGWL